MKVYYERATEFQGDLYSSELTIYRDDAGDFWIKGSGGAGTVFSEPDALGGQRSGSAKHRIGTDRYTDLSVVNEMYALGLELPDQYIDTGLQEFVRDYKAAGLPVGWPLQR